jgi:hypothetical protein
LTATKGFVPFVDTSNALSQEKRQQVIALGRLGWPLRRIEQETGVRRETASTYLKSAGIGVRPLRAWGRRPPAKPANEVITGSTEESPAANGNPNPKSLPVEGKGQTAKPANEVNHRCNLDDLERALGATVTQLLPSCDPNLRVQ